MLIKTGYPNLLHSFDFLCFILMNYLWVWEVSYSQMFKCKCSNKSTVMLYFFHRRSNPTGIYNITVGNKTWPRQCEMKGVEGCGNGAWELVMRIKGDRNKVLNFQFPAKLPRESCILQWNQLFVCALLCNSVTQYWYFDGQFAPSKLRFKFQFAAWPNVFSY